MAEFDGVADDCGSGRLSNGAIASIVLQGWSNVVPIKGTIVP